MNAIYPPLLPQLFYIRQAWLAWNSLCSSGWMQTHRDLPTSASPWLETKGRLVQPTYSGIFSYVLTVEASSQPQTILTKPTESFQNCCHYTRRD